MVRRENVDVSHHDSGRRARDANCNLAAAAGLQFAKWLQGFFGRRFPRPQNAEVFLGINFSAGRHAFCRAKFVPVQSGAVKTQTT
jgi:hypothetical protein